MFEKLKIVTFLCLRMEQNGANSYSQYMQWLS